MPVYSAEQSAMGVGCLTTKVVDSRMFFTNWLHKAARIDLSCPEMEKWKMGCFTLESKMQTHPRNHKKNLSTITSQVLYSDRMEYLIYHTSDK